MLTALVLVCSLAATPDLAACNRENALDVMRVPEQFAGPGPCALDGQAYLAQTAIGRNLSDNEAVKVICVPSTTVGAVSIRSARDEWVTGVAGGFRNELLLGIAGSPVTDVADAR